MTEDSLQDYFNWIGQNSFPLSLQEEQELTAQLEECRNIMLHFLIDKRDCLDLVPRLIEVVQKEKRIGDVINISHFPDYVEMVRSIGQHVTEINALFETQNSDSDYSYKVKCIVRQIPFNNEFIEQCIANIISFAQADNGVNDLAQTLQSFLILKQRLVISNLRLVITIAKHHFSSSQMSFLDRIQEGNLGLMKAVGMFDPKKGCKFSTYATRWIRQSISQAYISKSRQIRVPEYTWDQLRKVNQAKNALELLNSRCPSTFEVSQESQISEERIEQLMNVVRDPISYEQSSNTETDDGPTLFESFCESSPSPEELLSTSARTGVLQKVMTTLLPREEKILNLRMGFNGDERSVDEVSVMLSISCDRVNEIERRAVQKLRSPLRVQFLVSNLRDEDLY